MSYRFCILGCGSSGGVPRIDGDWGECDPNESRNRRSRCSLLIQRYAHKGGVTNVLIDTSPDLRNQMIGANVKHIDAVLFTHDHADHIHGIDDLRAFFLHQKKSIPVWMNTETAQTVTNRFEYCFREVNNSGYPPILKNNVILEDYSPVTIHGSGGTVTCVPFKQHHGRIISLGYRVANIVYSSDISDLPEESFSMIQNVDLWIVDALRYTVHASHFHLDKALDFIDKLGVKRAILTNLHIDMDYQSLKNALPSHVIPAYDGMEIEVE